MDIHLSEQDGKRFAEGIPGKRLLATADDVLPLLEFCYDHRLDMVLLYLENLPDDFLALRSGRAGGILQKFANYKVKVAAVIPQESIGHGKFREMVMEANRGKNFGVFATREAAVKWLVNS